MRNLINQIRAAQVRAAEDLVCESLRVKDLLIDEPVSEADQLAALKRDMFEKHRAAEQAAYAYFCACPVGDERILAHAVHENIRNATRV